MKTLLHCLLCAALLGGSRVAAQTYTNFIRQIQSPSLVQYDASVAATGQQLSALAINPGGANFQLWTVLSSPLTSYLLASSYVGTYIPTATVVVRSADGSGVTPRTRADQPFSVDLTVGGLLTGPSNPLPSESVTFYHYVQSYGTGGTGVVIDRTQATLMSQSSISTNGTQTLTFLINSVPGAVRTKVRGEERFSIFSLADWQAPASQLASQYIQIWPVADGSISGITSNQLVRYSLPQLTLTLNDLYPSSTTYAQVYKGEAQLGVSGKIVTGSALVVNNSVPQSQVLVVSGYDSVFDTDGRWTMELLTVTPFGIDRLAYVSFNLDRSIKMNSTFSTIK